MKAVFFCIVSILSFVGVANAQIHEPALAEVKYNFIHYRDTTDMNNPYTETLVLLLGKTSSSYVSYDAIKNKELVSNEINQQLKSAADPNHIDLTITGTRLVTTVGYYQQLITRKLLISQRLGNNEYLYEDLLPKIEWKISKDTITIKGLKCQRASTNFKGRQYEVWFCADIPFHTGPWKLSGLPGLIVQAMDSKKEVKFELNSFTNISDKKLMVALPEEATKISKDDFLRLQKLEQTDPNAFYKIAIQGKDSGPFAGIDKSKITSVNVKQVKVPFSTKINNPIELPE